MAHYPLTVTVLVVLFKILINYSTKYSILCSLCLRIKIIVIGSELTGFEKSIDSALLLYNSSVIKVRSVKKKMKLIHKHAPFFMLTQTIFVD